MEKLSGELRKAVERICSERCRAFSVTRRLSEMRRWRRFVRIRRTDEQVIEAPSVSQARRGFSGAITRAMKMTSKGIRTGKYCVVNRSSTRLGAAGKEAVSGSLHRTARPMMTMEG